ncbi:MAG: hypothetical protein IJO64_04745 [Clostridia bacterium]|nr:hypothetical protein [Clostridia bacterium]MBQ9848346.1 hypothetical protein [Clostridia bacterium]
MLKKALLCILALLFCLSFASCAKSNVYNLSYSSDGSEKIDYIYFEDDFAVYVIGGLMTAEIENEPMLLEQALTEGNISVSELLASAEEDASNNKLERVSYPDGSVQYNYEGFVMLRLNTYTGLRDIYFLPVGMGYYDIVK